MGHTDLFCIAKILDRPSLFWLNRGGYASRARFRSHSKSGTIADIAAPTLRAISGCEQVQQRIALLDHLVGAGEERRWHVEAERSRGLEVNRQFVLDWCLHR